MVILEQLVIFPAEGAKWWTKVGLGDPLYLLHHFACPPLKKGSWVQPGLCKGCCSLGVWKPTPGQTALLEALPQGHVTSQRTDSVVDPRWSLGLRHMGHERPLLHPI